MGGLKHLDLTRVAKKKKKKEEGGYCSIDILISLQEQEDDGE